MLYKRFQKDSQTKKPGFLSRTFCVFKFAVLDRLHEPVRHTSLEA